jgi:N-acetylglucosamine kinase-like BadF-type ATPase
VTVPALLAVDGGGSKTDLALLTADGLVLGAARGPESHPEHVGLEGSMAAIEAGLRGVLRDAGLPEDHRPAAELGVFCLAGDDLPSDHRRLSRALTRRRLVGRVVLRNDSFAMLRAGTNRDWGVAVVCGAGINCVGVAPGGRVVRFPALGDISGDWGGGGDVGMAALAAAIRGRDGRGPRTVLERTVPAHFGLRTPAALMEAVYRREIGRSQLRELTPRVFAASDDGDPVAAGIVDRLADEVVAMAVAAIRRLRLTRSDVEVVLGGGLFRSGNRRLLQRTTDGVLHVAPKAEVRPLRATPVAGAALLGLDLLRTDGAPRADVRGQLTEGRLAGSSLSRQLVANRA